MTGESAGSLPLGMGWSALPGPTEIAGGAEGDVTGPHRGGCLRGPSDPGQSG